MALRMWRTTKQPHWEKAKKLCDDIVQVDAPSRRAIQRGRGLLRIDRSKKDRHQRTDHRAQGKRHEQALPGDQLAKDAEQAEDALRAGAGDIGRGEEPVQSLDSRATASVRIAPHPCCVAAAMGRKFSRKESMARLDERQWRSNGIMPLEARKDANRRAKMRIKSIQRT